jgi:RNA polymerase sigma factor (sigma-70 family)
MRTHEDPEGRTVRLYFADVPDWYIELNQDMESKLRHYIDVKIGDLERAKELVQDVWTKHHENFKDMIERGPSISDEDLTYQKKWLYRTAKNKWIDELKKKDVRKRYDQSVAPNPVSINSPEDLVVRKEDETCIQKVLATMNPKHAEALELKEIFECGYPEIADILGMSRNSIGQTLSRARDTFKALLQEICPDLYLERDT